MRNKNLAFLAFALGISLCSACSTSKIQETKTQEDTNRESSVNIEYSLGRDHYLFTAQEKNLSATANTTLAGQSLAAGPVDHQQYGRFLKNALAYLNEIQTHPTPEKFCRSPFKLIVKLDSETRSATGCRSSDKGSLSKLIKEGEFLLLYSKN